MKTEKLFVIYSYVSSKVVSHKEDNEGVGPHYHITYIFDENGNIDPDILKKHYEELFLESKKFLDGEFIGPFENLTVLNRYSFEILKDLSGSEVVILSSDEFNSVLERSDTNLELVERMEKNGKIIENQDSAKKNSIFGKIFR